MIVGNRNHKRHLTLATFFFVSAVMMVCLLSGPAYAKSVEEIRKETQVDVKQYPFLVRFSIHKTSEDGCWVGSGALIAESWVVTAKHVAASFIADPEALSIVVKFQDRTTRRAILGFAHPDTDIAILKLDEPATHITPPALQSKLIPPFYFKKQLPMIVTGATGSWRGYNIIGHANYSHLYAPDILLGGDSGAPFIYITPKEKPVILSTLMGGVSFGKRKYAHSAQIGAVSDWIKEKMKTTQADVDPEGRVRWVDMMSAEKKESKKNRLPAKMIF